MRGRGERGAHVERAQALSKRGLSRRRKQGGPHRTGEELRRCGWYSHPAEVPGRRRLLRAREEVQPATELAAGMPPDTANLD